VVGGRETRTVKKSLGTVQRGGKKEGPDGGASRKTDNINQKKEQCARTKGGRGAVEGAQD